MKSSACLISVGLLLMACSPIEYKKPINNCDLKDYEYISKNMKTFSLVVTKGMQESEFQAQLSSQDIWPGLLITRDKVGEQHIYTFRNGLCAFRKYTFQSGQLIAFEELARDQEYLIYVERFTETYRSVN